MLNRPTFGGHITAPLFFMVPFLATLFLVLVAVGAVQLAVVFGASGLAGLFFAGSE
jgi:hypothetical protein